MFKRTYKIFLASSRELKEDRVAFADFIVKINKRLIQEKKVMFDLDKYEYDPKAFSDGRKQDTYNKHIEECAVFVMLYDTKVGGYTEEEYDFAYQKFKNTGTPQVMVFKKATSPTTDDSVESFEAKISKTQGQFKSYYRDSDDLHGQLEADIISYFTNGVLKEGEPATTINSDGQSVPENFIGREHELEVIHKRLGEGGNLMLLNAEGGIGKTTLAAKYWKESQYAYERNAWLFCENGIISELPKLAPGLNIDLSNLTAEQQLVNLKAALLNVANNFLLVLDNANNPKHIEEFRREFRDLNWHVLMTSRCKGVLELGKEYEIDHLPPNVAKALFTSIYKEDTHEFDKTLDQLLEAIHYNTLLVEIFGKNMIELKRRGENLADLLTQLEDFGLFLGKRSFEIDTIFDDNLHKQAATTDDILNIMYDFSKLEETERYWLVNMALLPAVPHSFLFLCEAFKQDKFEFKALAILAKKGWLNDDGINYRISPVVQKITLEKNKETLTTDSHALINNLNKKLENDGLFLRHFNTAGPFAALTETITKHLIKRPYYNLGLLNSKTCVYFLSTGNLSAALAAAKNFKIISEKLEDKTILAISFSRMGGIYEKMGRLNEALQFFNDEITLFEELHRQYPDDVSFKNGLAISYSKMGGIYEKMGHLNEALQFFEKYVSLEEELHREYPANVSFKNGLAISYEKMGGIYEKMGRLNEALQFFEQRSKFGEELHRQYPDDVSFKNGLAISYEKMGGIYEKMGRLNEALQFFDDDIKLSEELHRQYPDDVSFKTGLAISFIKIAGVLLKQGKKETALIKFKEAQTLWQQLAAAFPGYQEFVNNLAWVEGKLKEIGEGL